MVSGRSYSGFIDETIAIEKINKEIELFDPEIIKALTKAWNNGALTQRTSTLSRDTQPGLAGEETANNSLKKTQNKQTKNR
jgi:hypothetical protein